MKRFITREEYERAEADFDRSVAALEKAESRHQTTKNPVVRFVAGAMVRYRQMGVADSMQHFELVTELEEFEARMLNKPAESDVEQQ